MFLSVLLGMVPATWDGSSHKFAHPIVEYEMGHQKPISTLGSEANQSSCSLTNFVPSVIFFLSVMPLW